MAGRTRSRMEGELEGSYTQWPKAADCQASNLTSNIKMAPVFTVHADHDVFTGGNFDNSLGINVLSPVVR